jgi:hypothetical protein
VSWYAGLYRRCEEGSKRSIKVCSGREKSVENVSSLRSKAIRELARYALYGLDREDHPRRLVVGELIDRSKSSWQPCPELWITC